MLFTMLLQAEWKFLEYAYHCCQTQILSHFYSKWILKFIDIKFQLLIAFSASIYIYYDFYFSSILHKSFLFLNKIPNVYLKYLQFLCDSPFHNQYNFESFALFVIQLSREFIYIPKLTLKSAFVYCNPKIFILKKCIW